MNINVLIQWVLWRAKVIAMSHDGRQHL